MGVSARPSYQSVLQGNIPGVIFRLNELQHIFVIFPIMMTSGWKHEARDLVTAGSFPATAHLLPF